MTIREATISDVDHIHKLGEVVDEFDTGDEVVTFWPKHILQNCIQSKTDWIMVADENDEILGFSICSYSPVFKKAVVENIFISPNHQKKGIGKKLLEAVLEKVRSTDCENIVIYTEEHNQAAIELYIDNGFIKGVNCVWFDMVLSEEFRKK